MALGKKTQGSHESRCVVTPKKASTKPSVGASLLAMNDDAVYLKNRVVFIASRSDRRAVAPTLDEYSA
ncbi:hypothetical protein EAH72_10270 [Pseudomonas caspiana]|nr:hypothetical protein EAH72_10270 [Pseudomonas caspiana]